MNRQRTLLSATIILVAVTGCGANAASSTHSAPVVLTDTRGICPSQVVYGKTPPAACRFTRDWNGISGIFKTPHRQWGIAYAFNCGSHAGNFTADSRMPGMDHMGIEGPALHARHGSGYVMFSKRQMTDLIAAVPSEYKFDGKLMAVMIASRCTWHVKAILGSKQDVASAVPPIPTVRSPWWK